MKTSTLSSLRPTAGGDLLARRTLRPSLACLALLFSVGCGKSGESDKAAPSASTSTKAPLASSASTDSGASTATTATTATGKASSYAGTYSVSPAKIYIPSAKDYASVKQAKDDPTKHVGDGSLTLMVDANGHVTGTIDSGPASPALVDGSLVESEIRGTVRRKEPNDHGLTGTLVGKISGESVEGTLSLAEANASIVREGKLALKKK